MMPETREERTQTEDGTEHAESITSFKLDWTSSGIIILYYAKRQHNKTQYKRYEKVKHTRHATTK